MSLSDLAASDLNAMLSSDWGETATVAGVDVAAVFETDTGAVDEVENTIPSLLVSSSVAASTGGTVIYGGQGYTIIRIEHPWPDVQRLYLSDDARFAI